MKIDSFDNTLVFEKEDLQTVLSYFKDNRKLPEYLEKSVLQVILHKIGQGNIELESLEKYLECLPLSFVQRTVEDIRTMFAGTKKVSYKQNHLSYLLYYFPGNVFKVWKPILDLQLKSALKPQIRILDIGTGPGSVPVGIMEYYKTLAESFPELSFSLNFVLIECEVEFLDIAKELIERLREHLPDNLIVKVESTILEKVQAESDFSSIGKFDLITMSNFLTANENENENQDNGAAIINRLKYNIKNDGALIVIEPGMKKSCMALKKIRNEIIQEGEFNIFSPCVGIWEEKNEYDCKCFNMVRCYWNVPKIYQFLIRKGLSKADWGTVPFNYLVLRLDKLRKYSPIKNTQYFTRLTDLREVAGQMVNIIALIRTVIYKGDNIGLSLCDGSCSFLPDDSNAIWVNISNAQFEKNGINIPLISGEKITLKKVTVKLKHNKINLEFGNDSRITIDY